MIWLRHFFLDRLPKQSSTLLPIFACSGWRDCGFTHGVGREGEFTMSRRRIVYVGCLAAVLALTPWKTAHAATAAADLKNSTGIFPLAKNGTMSFYVHTVQDPNAANQVGPNNVVTAGLT